MTRGWRKGVPRRGCRHHFVLKDGVWRCDQCPAIRKPLKRTKIQTSNFQSENALSIEPLISKYRPIKRKKRLQPQSLSDHAVLIREADRLWRLIIRAKTDHCEACLRPDPGGRQPHGYGFQAAHGIRRTRHQTRWDLDNGFKLDQQCHARFSYNDEAWVDWMKQKIGAEAYEKLRLRSLVRGKIDMQLTIWFLWHEALRRNLDPTDPKIKLDNGRQPD